jgi:ATP-dependent Lon protease
MSESQKDEKNQTPVAPETSEAPATAATPAVPPVSAAKPTESPEPGKAAGIKVGTSVPRPAVAGSVLQQLQVPDLLPLLPVRGAVSFPGAVMPLTVGRDRSKRVLDEVLPAEKIIGVITQKNENTEDPQPSELYSIGTAALVLKMLRMPEGHLNIIVHGLVRFKILEIVGTEPYMKARVEVLADVNPPESPDFTLLVKSVRQAASRMIELSPNVPEEANVVLNNIETPGTLADFLAANLSGDVQEKQSILEEIDVTRRLERVRERLASRIELLELQAKIQSEVRSNIDKTQRNYFLQEQMKAIQKELGMEDGHAAEVTELRRRLDECKLPENVKKETDRELQRLGMIPQASPEFGVIRGFLDTVAELPWSKSTRDDLDIKKARRILDRDHYDLEKIKQRIIEYLAVRKLNPHGRGPILCFAGPPGVGKTSLGKSIAESLGRSFVRLSLGGVRDEADIRGHRRTYIGAMPGRIIQELRKAGSNNPVMMLDEIDKLGVDFRGDPASALLEVLDPEQNNSFTDHYLGVPFDLRNVIFICTANYMEPVPAALKDRMEIIDVPGYTQHDKLLIARKYLLPRQLSEHGVTREQCKIPTKTIEAIIGSYTRESGVRNLNRTIASVVRGVAAKIAEEMPQEPFEKPGAASGGDTKLIPAASTVSVTVLPEELSKYLGPTKFESELAQRTATPGVVTGLAYTPVGGEILFIEATQMPGKGGLQLTGQIGEVMKESAQAAFSLVKSHAEKLGIPADTFAKTDVHVHVPAGAVPKDGPSAGVAMYTALASLFLNRPARPDLAMTGEITLRGLVLPIGGVKEKVIAAQRAGIKTIVLPERNRKNLEEIREEIRKSVKFEFAENVDQVLHLALGKVLTPLPATKAGTPNGKANGKPARSNRIRSQGAAK